MSIDYVLFSEQMRGGDPLATVLKGHLWVEACLNRSLEGSLAVPESVKLDRMAFAAKVDLCRGLGHLHSSEEETLRALNRVRNRLAHQLDAVVTSADLDAIVHTLAGPSKAQWDIIITADHYLNGKLAARFAYLFYVLLSVLEYGNMRRAWESENTGQLTAFHLIKALDEENGRVRTDDERAAKAKLPPPPDPRAVWSDQRDPETGKVRSFNFAPSADSDK